MENCFWNKIKYLCYKVEKTDIVVLILVEIDSFKSKCTCHRPDLSNNGCLIKVHKVAQILIFLDDKILKYFGLLPGIALRVCSLFNL